MKLCLMMGSCGRGDDIVDLVEWVEKESYEKLEVIVVEENDRGICDVFEE
ncbi:hypothetical protein [Bacillus mycoides]|nr:hypothetical protein [Bacillus mycoides]